MTESIRFRILMSPPPEGAVMFFRVHRYPPMDLKRGAFPEGIRTLPWTGSLPFVPSDVLQQQTPVPLNEMPLVFFQNPAPAPFPSVEEGNDEAMPDTNVYSDHETPLEDLAGRAVYRLDVVGYTRYHTSSLAVLLRDLLPRLPWERAVLRFFIPGGARHLEVPRRPLAFYIRFQLSSRAGFAWLRRFRDRLFRGFVGPWGFATVLLAEALPEGWHLRYHPPSRPHRYFPSLREHDGWVILYGSPPGEVRVPLGAEPDAPTTWVPAVPLRPGSRPRGAKASYRLVSLVPRHLAGSGSRWAVPVGELTPREGPSSTASSGVRQRFFLVHVRQPRNVCCLSHLIGWTPSDRPCPAMPWVGWIYLEQRRYALGAITPAPVPGGVRTRQGEVRDGKILWSRFDSKDGPRDEARPLRGPGWEIRPLPSEVRHTLLVPGRPPTVVLLPNLLAADEEAGVTMPALKDLLGATDGAVRRG